MESEIKIALISLSSPLEVGSERGEVILKEFKSLFEKKKVKVVFSDSINTEEKSIKVARNLKDFEIDAVIMIPVSWFEDYLVGRFLDFLEVPLFFWSIPLLESGSLCATQQISYYLNSLKKSFDVTYGEINNENCLNEALSFIKSAKIKKILKHSKVAIIGSHIRGMTETYFDELSLKKVFGIEIFYLDINKILEKRIEKKYLKEMWENVKNKAGKVKVDDKIGERIVSFYLSLEKIIKMEKISAIAFGCYPDYMGLACLSASLLSDKGIPVSCEGDINGAIGMLILQNLSSSPSFNTDFLEPVEDTIIFSHCGSSSFTLSSDRKNIILSPVRLKNEGVCCLFPLKEGQVTLLNIVKVDNTYRFSFLEGEAVKTDLIFPGNPIKIRFNKKPDEIIKWIFDNCIGHHWMGCYGHYGKEIIKLGKIFTPSIKIQTL